jgi:hypothetical protein
LGNVHNNEDLKDTIYNAFESSLDSFLALKILIHLRFNYDKIEDLEFLANKYGQDEFLGFLGLFMNILLVNLKLSPAMWIVGGGIISLSKINHFKEQFESAYFQVAHC